jgi:hypothetical protein
MEGGRDARKPLSGTKGQKRGGNLFIFFQIAKGEAKGREKERGESG